MRADLARIADEIALLDELDVFQRDRHGDRMLPPVKSWPKVPMLWRLLAIGSNIGPRYSYWPLQRTL